MNRTQRSWNSTLRAGKRLKRTELKRTAFKRQRKPDDRKLDRVRAKWRKQFALCHICNRRHPCSVHEILGGKWRHITKRLRVFWLAVCDGPGGCHGIIQSDSVNWPAARQLYQKKLHNPEDFDLEEFNRITAGIELPITQQEVDKWL